MEGNRRQPKHKITMEQLFLVSQLPLWTVEVLEHSLSLEEPGKVILFDFFLIAHRKQSDLDSFFNTNTRISTDFSLLVFLFGVRGVCFRHLDS